MDYINAIYLILLRNKLVTNEEQFSTTFCKRHKKWMKDSNYHNFTPTLYVLLNIRDMLKILYDTFSDEKHDTLSLYIKDEVHKCLVLISRAIGDHHSDTMTKLTEVFLQSPSELSA